MDKPKVTLLSWTSWPVETIYAVWEASKGEGPLLDPMIKWDGKDGRPDVDKEEMTRLFLQILDQRIPVSEHVNFVFMLENVSVSFREQMVRHRIGISASPERLGIDMIPDLSKSSFWSQSMRIQSMEEFARQQHYRIADSIASKGKAMAIYEQAVHSAERAYRSLLEAGVPMEDARDVIPLGATHRISWSLNLSALLPIIGERSCWILQHGLWGPVIQGIANELEAKVDPIFRRIVAPPCVDRMSDRFNRCAFRLENERRVDMADALPPCPLYLCADAKQRDVPPASPEELAHFYDESAWERMVDYEKMWAHDPLYWRKEG